VGTLGRLRARTVCVAGLGSKDSAGAKEVRRAGASAIRRLGERSEVASALHCAVSGSTSAAVEGFVLGAYSFAPYKADRSGSKVQRVVHVDAPQEDVERGAAYASATVIARDLANEPANALTPAAFADRARAIADVNGLACEVLDEKELADRGFGGIIDVGKGSSSPPRLIHFTYEPEDPTGRVAIIGKGITFDSGGLSIKPAQSMETMKTDMSGGAAVIGALAAAARLRARIAVDAYVPAAENMVSGSSFRPGDVVRHYGGRTSEILNTDAEGRLVLADALALASESKPDAIVDIATLTGSMAIATGTRLAGYFSNDDDLAAEVQHAAEEAGENFWRMPLLREYRPDLDSPIADSRSTASRYGGAIYAALFLESFVSNGIPWAHLDIAGSSRSDKDYDDISRGATGRGARTLAHWMTMRGG
jgi:leucyl aminopeptidase